MYNPQKDTLLIRPNCTQKQKCVAENDLKEIKLRNTFPFKSTSWIKFEVQELGPFKATMQNKIKDSFMNLKEYFL